MITFPSFRHLFGGYYYGTKNILVLFQPTTDWQFVEWFKIFVCSRELEIPQKKSSMIVPAINLSFFQVYSMGKPTICIQMMFPFTVDL